jgi:hypothetical protein
MIFFFGTRRLGTVYAALGGRVVTEFACVNHLPIFPVRSRFLIGQEDHAIAFVPVSIAAAYLRAWGPIALIAAFFVLGPSAPFFAGGIWLAALTSWGFLRFGKLSADEIAKRRAYATIVSFPIDVALLVPDDAERLRERLLREVVEQAPAVMSSTYRSAPDPARDWPAIALDPTVRDPAFLCTAMTLARVASARAVGEERRALERAHAAIWKKLRTDPALLASNP